MSERRDFQKWKVELVYRLQDGVCSKCGAPLSKGFHRHHKDGDPSNNSIDNLELLCPKCHYATFGDDNPFERHKRVERKVFDQIQQLLDKAFSKELSGAHIEKILDALTLELKLSRSVENLDWEIERPPASIALEYRIAEMQANMRAYVEGFKEGFKQAMLTLQGIRE